MSELTSPLAQDNDEGANPKGSIWHRWDPHIHMPGTLNSDNFKGEDALERFVEKLNSATPVIRAVGITDYYVLDSYEKLKEVWEAGKLPNVRLLFPNIELRFAVNAAKGSPINVHLLVSPDDPDHVNQTKRFLRNLKFEYDKEKYCCTNDDLVRLGRAINKEIQDDQSALKLGALQFKVTDDDIRQAFKDSKWARKNIMVGIAAGKNDGTAQMQQDGLKALREELQRLSNIVFSGRPGDRSYWCGEGPDTLEMLRSKYGGPKPCLHGSDAHDLDSVGNPDENRFCWIKGDLAFETLRHTCFEPRDRVFIGIEAPSNGRPSNTISEVRIKGGKWLKTPTMPLNAGLVAIIGARGSGKTALAELIAVGAQSVDSTHTKRSFLERAKEHISGVKSSLTWEGGEITSSSANIAMMFSPSLDPRVRYLSQQFVDQLCSSDGLADELLEEIERVIFEAHPPESRLGSRNFAELRELRTQAIRRNKVRCSEILIEIGNELSVQLDMKRNLKGLERSRMLEFDAIGRMKKDRIKLTPTDNKELLERLDEVRSAAETKLQEIARLEKRRLKLVSLQEETRQFSDIDASSQLVHLKERYAEAELSEEQWQSFLLSYKGNVNRVLEDEIAKVECSLVDQKGPAKDETPESAEPNTAAEYFTSDVVLDELTHSLLLKEQRRLEAKIGVDKERRRKYTNLSNQISRAESQLIRRDREITDAKASSERISELISNREEAYFQLISQLEQETHLLEELYKPLQDRLSEQEGVLGKLSFSISRDVDIDAWAEAGERLIDRSKAGPFRGIGSLTQIIRDELEDVWENGTAKDIAVAMAKFRKDHSNDFRKHAFEDALKNREVMKQWSDQVSAWLYGTDHVEITYGLEYESVNIQQLSPGTRGIVLLLLYLAIDMVDERPLIIDQPEENLDPKSIYHELVGRFKEAKLRRQIIIVTHNANLVVNSDADQIIVASRGEHNAYGLPDISYVSGGLENPKIRAAVCEILEGGADAFSERAKRLNLMAY